MTEPAGDVLTDPVAAVVAVVTAVDEAVDQDTVRAAVERAGGGRARRRRLAAALAADPSLLTSGRSPAPTVVGDLLLALRGRGNRDLPAAVRGLRPRGHLDAAPRSGLVLLRVRPAAGVADVRIVRPAAAGRQP
jgi:hypothetical protein